MKKFQNLTFGLLQKRIIYDVMFTSSQMLKKSVSPKLDAVEYERVGRVRHIHALNLGK